MISHADRLAAVRREIAMRERAYPGFVKSGRLTQAKADLELATMRTILDALQAQRRALYMAAAHCQGGNSAAGRAAAEVLGVPFPIRMEFLIRRAAEEGFQPSEMWPWLAEALTGENAPLRELARKISERIGGIA